LRFVQLKQKYFAWIWQYNDFLVGLPKKHDEILLNTPKKCGPKAALGRFWNGKCILVTKNSLDIIENLM